MWLQREGTDDIGRRTAGTRLLVWEETWDALGVRASLSVQEAGVLHVGSQLSAPAKQDAELAILGSSLGLYPGKSPGWLGMTEQRYRALKSLLAHGVERASV